MLQKGQEVEVIYHRDGDMRIHNPANEEQFEELKIIAPNEFAHPVHNFGVGRLVRQLLQQVGFWDLITIDINAVLGAPMSECVSVTVGNIEGKWS